MDKTRVKIFRMIMLAMMVAIGVVISPILRIEGMCPTAHLVNIVCSVLMGPWYSLLCATLIGVIRMMFMGIPPLADGCSVWCVSVRCVLSAFRRENHLRSDWRGIWNRDHRFDCILSGDGISDGKRRTERILLYAHVSGSYTDGRNGCIFLPENLK